MSMEKFTLNVRETVVLRCRLGEFRSDLETYERVMGMTAAQLLARWEQIHTEGAPVRLSARRDRFVRLPHCAQAAAIAEWEGEMLDEPDEFDLGWPW